MLEKFDSYSETPYFTSMEDIEKIINLPWEACRTEAKEAIAKGMNPDDKDDERREIGEVLGVVRSIIEEAEKGLRFARTETEAKVCYAVLREAMGRRDELEEAWQDSLITCSMMYQEEGTPHCWVK